MTTRAPSETYREGFRWLQAQRTDRVGKVDCGRQPLSGSFPEYDPKPEQCGHK